MISVNQVILPMLNDLSLMISVNHLVAMLLIALNQLLARFSKIQKRLLSKMVVSCHLATQPLFSYRIREEGHIKKDSCPQKRGNIKKSWEESKTWSSIDDFFLKNNHTFVYSRGGHWPTSRSQSTSLSWSIVCYFIILFWQKKILKISFF